MGSRAVVLQLKDLEASKKDLEASKKDLEASNAHLQSCLRKTERERDLAEQRAEEVQRAAERRAAEGDARLEAEERERERWRKGEMERGVTPAFIQAQVQAQV